MAIKYSDFLDSSREAFCKKDEISYRNGISRAYYAMYHCARKSLPALPSFSGSQHSGLIDYMKSNNAANAIGVDKKILVSCAYILNAARQMRHKADYSLQMNIEENMASDAINIADEFICRLNEIMPANPQE